MGFSAEFEKFLWEGIVFLAYLLIVGGLIRRRFSKTASLLAAGGTLAGIVLLQAGLLMAGGQKVPISRNVYSKLKEAYMKYTF